MSAKRPKELSDNNAIQIVLKSHPEWRTGWERGTLPDEVIGEDGQPMSPRMHIAIHTIVERQLATDDPKGIVAIAHEMEQAGMSSHEVRHAIGQAVSGQLWAMSKERRAFNSAQYFAELRRIIESHKQGGMQ